MKSNIFITQVSLLVLYQGIQRITKVVNILWGP